MNNLFILVLIGLLAGWLSGLVGIGGGIIIVPALVFFLGYSIRDAQGTSISALIPPVGLVAAYYYYKNGNVNVPAALIISSGFIFGGIIGAKTSYSIRKDVLEKIFGIILITIAVKIFFFPKN
jgi:uncharacterized membrane protein YfcA